MHERSEYLNWALFFVAGSLAGAGAALLLPPQSGRETRGRVARRLRRAGRSTRRVQEGAAVLAGNGGDAEAWPSSHVPSR
jgi:hypothetical protein